MFIPLQRASNYRGFFFLKMGCAFIIVKIYQPRQLRVAVKSDNTMYS